MILNEKIKILENSRKKILLFNSDVIGKHTARLSELEKKIKTPEQSLLSAPLSPPLSNK